MKGQRVVLGQSLRWDENNQLKAVIQSRWRISGWVKTFLSQNLCAQLLKLSNKKTDKSHPQVALTNPAPSEHSPTVRDFSTWSSNTPLSFYTQIRKQSDICEPKVFMCNIQFSGALSFLNFLSSFLSIVLVFNWRKVATGQGINPLQNRSLTV